MVFENGQHCWSGPNRSIRVRPFCHSALDACAPTPEPHLNRNPDVDSVHTRIQPFAQPSTILCAKPSATAPTREVHPGLYVAWAQTHMLLPGQASDIRPAAPRAEACLGASQLTLVCGAGEKLVSVEEPSRCTYAAQLASPALCTHADHAALR